MQVTVCKPITVAAKAPKMPGHVATGFPLPSTGRGIEGEGCGHIQSPLPREPPVVGEVALRLRLPAEQALCGVASPGGLRMTLWPSKQPSFPNASLN